MSGADLECCPRDPRLTDAEQHLLAACYHLQESARLFWEVEGRTIGLDLRPVQRGAAAFLESAMQQKTAFDLLKRLKDPTVPLFWLERGDV